MGSKPKKEDKKSVTDFTLQGRYLVVHRTAPAIDSTDEKNVAQGMPYELLDVLHNLHGLATWKDKDSRFMGCNKKTLLVNQLQLKDIVGFTDEKMPWGENGRGALIQNEDKRILAGGTAFILHRYTINGKEVSLIAKKQPLIDSDKRIIGVVTHGAELLNLQVNFIIAALIQMGAEISPGLIHAIKKVYKNNEIAIRLTLREEQCLHYLLRGVSPKEISEILNLSPRTVEDYIDSLKEKFQCNKTSQLISKAIQYG